MARPRAHLLLIGVVAAVVPLIAILLILDSDNRDHQAGVPQSSEPNEVQEDSVSESTVPEEARSRPTDRAARSASDGQAETTAAAAPSIEQEQSGTAERSTGSISDVTDESTTLWCFDGDRQIVYSEAEPGSAKRSEFSDCLRSAAQRGEVIAIEGQLLDAGLLLDVGSGSLLWRFETGYEREITMYVTGELMMFSDQCDGRIEHTLGVLAETNYSYCANRGIALSDSRVGDPNFTIYVIGSQFVAVGEDGWYHIDVDGRVPGAGNVTYASVKLSNPNFGVWIEAEEDLPESGHGTAFRIRRPLAGNRANLQAIYAADWEYRVWAELVPWSFREAAQVFFPDARGYWTVMRDWSHAIMHDLLSDHPDPVRLNWEATEHGLLNSEGYNVGDSFFGPFTLLHSIAKRMTSDDAQYSPRFVATLLMLWERYIPDFDLVKARDLATRYTVEIGDPISVNAPSERTGLVHDILNRRPNDASSDYEAIDPEDLHLSVTLEVGQQAYEVVVSSNLEPGCGAQYRDDGTFSGWYINPTGEFTINAGGYWNGIALAHYSGVGESGMIVYGTPTVPGRVRVKVTTQCPEGVDQEPRFVGYSEIVVVDPSETG